MITTGDTMSKCRHCGMWHGVRCPFISAIEYYPDGSIKRVTFVTSNVSPATEIKISTDPA